MNKFIKTDIEQALILLRTAINNALYDIENGTESEIILGDHVPFSLVVECAEERGWIRDTYHDWDTNGWECDCWYYMLTPDNKSVEIWSCLFKGQETRIILSNENN
jgi:hypothetical protein